jgi:2'-5' RNA ligase superfamily
VSSCHKRTNEASRGDASDSDRSRNCPQDLPHAHLKERHEYDALLDPRHQPSVGRGGAFEACPQCPMAEALMKAFRDKYDPSAAAGMPAHITLLYPFKPPAELAADVLDSLHNCFSRFLPFSYSLVAVRRFPAEVLPATRVDEKAPARVRRTERAPTPNAPTARCPGCRSEWARAGCTQRMATVKPQPNPTRTVTSIPRSYPVTCAPEKRNS